LAGKLAAINHRPVWDLQKYRGPTGSEGTAEQPYLALVKHSNPTPVPFLPVVGTT